MRGRFSVSDDSSKMLTTSDGSSLSDTGGPVRYFRSCITLVSEMPDWGLQSDSGSNGVYVAGSDYV